MQDDETSAAVTSTSATGWLAELGVVAAAAAIRDGEVTAESYSAALLRRARDYADLNSFISIDESAVLAAAREADRARADGFAAPLLGVPLGIKDSYTTRGLRTTLGVGILDSFVPAEDATIVTAVRKAGAIVFGKNNLVEMSYGLTGNNIHYGQVKNPHSFDRVSGGSSSGSAAAVAAQIVPAALGNDSLGSIRMPASLCGVVGFKPTTGRWSCDGVAPISHTLDAPGVLARSVEDCALIDEIVTRATVAPFSQASLKGTKFAYAPRQCLELIEPDIEKLFEDTCERLREAGAEIIEVDLGGDFSLIAEQSTWNIFFRETLETIPAFLQRHKFPVSFEEIYNQLDPEIKSVWNEIVLPSGPGRISADVYETAITVGRPEIQRRFQEAFARNGIQAFLFPTTPCTAPLIHEQAKFRIADNEVSDLALVKNTVATSGAGMPGVSIPVGLSGRRLPIGIEIDGAPNHDRSLLDLARRVEQALGSLGSPAQNNR